MSIFSSFSKIFGAQANRQTNVFKQNTDVISLVNSLNQNLESLLTTNLDSLSLVGNDSRQNTFSTFLEAAKLRQRQANFAQDFPGVSQTRLSLLE